MAVRATRRIGIAVTLCGLVVGVAGCGTTGATRGQAQAGSGTGTITMWAHDGTPAEDAAIQRAVADFNALHDGVTVSLTLIPSATYTQTITSTPTSSLPDVLEFDGPTMAGFVYAGKLSPVTAFLAPPTIANQIDSVTAQNTYRGQRYGVSLIDSGLGLYGNKAMLDAAGVRYPTTWSAAWTADAFTAALTTLAARSPTHVALDVQENGFSGEWPSYGFLPIVNSTGNVVVRNNTARGNLNSPQVIAAIQRFASWRGYIDPNTDGNAFTGGRVGLSWVGHWEYPTYHQALGDNLVVLPLPNFGAGAKTGQGSWAWGITTNSRNGKAAGRFLDYLTSDHVVTAYTDADGAPPATRTVLATDPLYKAGGPLYLYSQALQHSCAGTPGPDCIATPRPVTPAYPVISEQFGTVIREALAGGDVTALLNHAADTIDLAYQQNNNYAQ
jgi:multiple sugar transport system substrate-binding protein